LGDDFDFTQEFYGTKIKTKTLQYRIPEVYLLLLSAEQSIPQHRNSTGNETHHHAVIAVGPAGPWLGMNLSGRLG
jgi:hypothetical protein